jgi:hypothetical protein
MKTKLVSAIMTGMLACNGSTGVRRVNTPTVAELTAVNMAPYNPTRPAVPREQDFSLQAILGADQARSSGASQIYVYSMSERNPVRPFVRGPWNGVCVNEPAINYIAANTRQAIAVAQEEQFVRTQTLGAQAQRDIALMQSDYRLMREAYQAQIRNYEISLTEADGTIVSLRRNNLWQNIGIGIGGVLLGVGVSGLILLTR